MASEGASSLSTRPARSGHSGYFCIAWVPRGGPAEWCVEAHVCIFDNRWIIRIVWPDQCEEVETAIDDVALCERLNLLHATLRDHEWTWFAPVGREADDPSWRADGSST